MQKRELIFDVEICWLDIDDERIEITELTNSKLKEPITIQNNTSVLINFVNLSIVCHTTCINIESSDYLKKPYYAMVYKETYQQKGREDIVKYKIDIF